MLEGDNEVNWYVIHVIAGRESQLIRFFNNQNDTIAFIPKLEKWYSIKGKKSYILQDLYPDYVFVKSSLNKKQFDEVYKEFFKSIGGFALLLEYDEVTALTKPEQDLMERMLQGSDVIRHSDGNITNKVLKIDSGPLMGMEHEIKKIDRHKRLAFLDCHFLGKLMKVPLEIVNKS